jgi:hypothetical protein
MKTNEPASPDQVRFITNLVSERRTVLGIEDVAAWVTAQALETLTKESASKLIDDLLAVKGPRDIPEGYAGPESDKIIVNKYAKPCALCSTEVAEKAGHAALIGPNKWATFHRMDDCGEAPEASGIDLSVLLPFLSDTGHGNDSAYFAHPAHADGFVKGVTRLKVKVWRNQKSGWLNVANGAYYRGFTPEKVAKAQAEEEVAEAEAGLAPQSTSEQRTEYGRARRYGGQRPGSGDYVGGITEVLAAIVADPTEAMRAYGHLVGHCSRCLAPLERESSLARGMGDICAAKVGLI